MQHAKQFGGRPNAFGRPSEFVEKPSAEVRRIAANTNATDAAISAKHEIRSETGPEGALVAAVRLQREPQA